MWQPFSSRIHLIALAITGGMCFVACTPVPNVPQVPDASAPTIPAGPGTADPGTCWDKTVTPAVIETVTERVLIAPADISPEGLIRQPAKYRNEERPRIVQPRQETWYQLVCAADQTPPFIMTVQRALAARGYYSGAIIGELNTETRDAIARYQTAQDLPGRDLTLAAAEQLGLIAITAAQ